MKNTDRFIALALCFTLTLGAFAYRPPTAKAVAVVDDAIVIGALLTAFSAGCGLIFSNNGMTSSEIASAMTTKWSEYKETLSDTVSSFSAWLGYDDMDALITDLRWDQVKECLAIPRAVARKLLDFTSWLKTDLVIPSDVSVSVANLPGCTFDGSPVAYGHLSICRDDGAYSFDGITSFCTSRGTELVNPKPTTTGGKLLSFGQYQFYVSDYGGSSMVRVSVDWGASFSDWVRIGSTYRQLFFAYDTAGVLCYVSSYFSGDDERFTVHRINGYLNSAFRAAGLDISLSGFTVSDANFNVKQNPAVEMPDISNADDTAPTPTVALPNTIATDIEDLLQKILDQVQANTLAPTLDVAGTETGGDTDTDTDEDSKPYLPYIPRIFSKLETLPQDIADKVKGLFVPDEALLTEITDTFKGKFGFLPVLKQFADDLFGMTPETDPPVIWIHLENAESKYGYNYGGKTKALDLTWYQKYKANVDSIVSGFLWLAFLWLLFKRASSIIQGGEMVEQYSADISAGHREKGGKRK